MKLVIFLSSVSLSNLPRIAVVLCAFEVEIIQTFTYDAFTLGVQDQSNCVNRAILISPRAKVGTPGVYTRIRIPRYEEMK